MAERVGRVDVQAVLDAGDGVVRHGLLETGVIRGCVGEVHCRKRRARYQRRLTALIYGGTGQNVNQDQGS